MLFLETHGSASRTAGNPQCTLTLGVVSIHNIYLILYTLVTTPQGKFEESVGLEVYRIR